MIFFEENQVKVKVTTMASEQKIKYFLSFLKNHSDKTAIVENQKIGELAHPPKKDRSPKIITPSKLPAIFII